MEKLGSYSTTLGLGQEMTAFRQAIEQLLLSCGGDPEAVADVIIALNESLVNVLRHGYQQPTGHVEVSLLRDEQALRVEVCDDAPLFDPTTVPSPDITVPLAQRPFGGMGVHMMREFVDELVYQPTANGRNQLILVKNETFINVDS